jgi:hypothetical protein
MPGKSMRGIEHTRRGGVIRVLILRESQLDKAINNNNKNLVVVEAAVVLEEVEVELRHSADLRLDIEHKGQLMLDIMLEIWVVVVVVVDLNHQLSSNKHQQCQ